MADCCQQKRFRSVESRRAPSWLFMHACTWQSLCVFRFRANLCEKSLYIQRQELVAGSLIGGLNLSLVIRLYSFSLQQLLLASSARAVYITSSTAGIFTWYHTCYGRQASTQLILLASMHLLLRPQQRGRSPASQEILCSKEYPPKNAHSAAGTDALHCSMWTVADSGVDMEYLSINTRLIRVAHGLSPMHTNCSMVVSKDSLRYFVLEL